MKRCKKMEKQSHTIYFCTTLSEISKWQNVMWWEGHEVSSICGLRKTRGFWITAGVHMSGKGSLLLFYFDSVSFSFISLHAAEDRNLPRIHQYDWLSLQTASISNYTGVWAKCIMTEQVLLLFINSGGKCSSYNYYVTTENKAAMTTFIRI